GEHHGEREAEDLHAYFGDPQQHAGGDRRARAREAAKRQRQSLYGTDDASLSGTQTRSLAGTLSRAVTGGANRSVVAWRLSPAVAPLRQAGQQNQHPAHGERRGNV